jgi:radical SAM protein with 4Fe4S-binding SPASM domain
MEVVMSPESLVDANWIVPAVPELKVVERDGAWLCLNPEVPAWLRTTQSGALLLQLVDGHQSIEDLHSILTASGIPASIPQLSNFFQKALAAKLFEKPEHDSSTLPWESRKLSAMYLHLTNRCNLQCSYCYRESSPHLPILHDSRRFCEMFEYIKPFTSPNMTITFSGGEPLMHPGFREIAQTAVSLGYSNALLTNATLISEENADFIRDHFRFVKISLDGPNEETHAKTRGKGNFARVLKGIERLAHRGVRVKVQVTLAKSTLPNLGDIKKVVPDLPNVNVTFTPLLPMGRGAEMDSEGVDNETFYEFAQGRRSVGRYTPGQRIRSCHAGLSNLSIADTGDVYPCHHFHSGEFHFGNIFHDPFGEIFFGEKIRDYVRSMDVMHNNPECAACEVRFLCGGGCHANTLHAMGDYRGADTFCSYLKRVIYDDLFASTAPQGSRPQELPVA